MNPPSAMTRDEFLIFMSRIKAAASDSYLVPPQNISPAVISLCDHLSGQPQFVRVQPMPSEPMNECVSVVRKKVEGDGGSLMVGWQIWERPTVFIEAELHAVWVAPDETLIDVSPKLYPMKRILFVPDPTRSFTDIRQDNIRMALRDDPLVKEYISGNEEYQRAIGLSVGFYKRTKEIEEMEWRLAELDLKLRDMTPRHLIDEGKKAALLTSW